MRSGDPIRRLVKLALTLSGQAARGRRNALDLRLEHNHFHLPHWPEELDGFRMLQLSDPHIPETGDQALIEGIATLAEQTPHELTVLTGDYRDRSFGPHAVAMEAMARLRSSFADRAFAILGNHDSIESVDALEAADYEVLVNETQHIQFNGVTIDVLGVDDPSYYRQHDLNECAAKASNPHKMLLSHSPDIYRDAEHSGLEIMLCGHTHGGQFCLPNGYPLRHASKVDVDLLSGPWQRGALNGYTSRGAGTSIVDARFFCPPELTLHTIITR